MLATRNGLSLDEATAALDDALESGQLVEEDLKVPRRMTNRHDELGDGPHHHDPACGRRAAAPPLVK